MRNTIILVYVLQSTIVSHIYPSSQTYNPYINIWEYMGSIMNALMNDGIGVCGVMGGIPNSWMDAWYHGLRTSNGWFGGTPMTMEAHILDGKIMMFVWHWMEWGKTFSEPHNAIYFAHALGYVCRWCDAITCNHQQIDCLPTSWSTGKWATWTRDLRNPNHASIGMLQHYRSLGKKVAPPSSASFIPSMIGRLGR